MDGRKQARHQPRQIDAADFDQPLFVDRRGNEFRNKPGRKKKLSAEQAAAMFEAQVQIRAARKLIERLLDTAGVRGETSRSRICKLNWRDRGRIDVLHSGPTKAKR